jgi:3-oxosteroid 1-dehydrogenase
MMASTNRPDRPDEVDVDVLVVGSGAAGLVSALTVKAAGLEPLIIEKSVYFGGSTARSGGGAWIPNAPALTRRGQVDDPNDVIQYLVKLTDGRVGYERIVQYVDSAPKMMSFLESQSELLSNGFFWIPGYPDYHPELGGHPLGRGLWARPIDRRLLGEEQKFLHPGVRRMQLPLGAWITSEDLHDLLAIRWGGIKTKGVLFKMAYRSARARILGERIGVSGQALVTRLRLTTREKGIELWRETPMQELLADEDGKVTGVRAVRGGKTITIRARHGVVMASGGFDHNLARRAEYQPGIDHDWSLGSATNEGDGIWAGQRLGAATDLMEDAWWIPTMPSSSDGTLVGLVAERQYPGQFIVNADGRRFVNESTPYVDFGHAQLGGHASGVSHIPSWMIIDSRSWKRNIIAGHLPGTGIPKNWRENGVIHTAESIEGLADAVGLPRENLRATFDRFNQFARVGKDDDFGRGDSVYDNYYGDHSLPNPNLCPVTKSPFYALALTPGDLGTKGGLLTDAHARVLRPDGSVIEGLYASGNASASVMGPQYAGPGATLGPAMTFAWLAGNHIAAAANRRPRTEPI